jgi:transaldolase
VKITDLKIKIFADGADLQDLLRLAGNPVIKGFTTNPTLMRKAGITDYVAFARQVLDHVKDRPVSFEVFSDDLDEMIAQGREIASWGKNVNVKIPVTNTKGEFTGRVISALSGSGVVVNVTAVFTVEQVRKVAAALSRDTKSIVSVFAGRIADTGRDPVPVLRDCLAALKDRSQAELLWASTREFLNIFHANDAGCHIITVTNDQLAKLPLVGKDLDAYSLETVEMFRKDAVASAFDIPIRAQV